MGRGCLEKKHLQNETIDYIFHSIIKKLCDLGPVVPILGVFIYVCAVWAYMFMCLCVPGHVCILVPGGPLQLLSPKSPQNPGAAGY